jgi:flagellar hook assembly protein FlgD
VAVLVNGTQSPAFYTVRWDGKDHQGANVPSGMYLIRLQVGEKQIVNKAMLIR